jgi:hypothetical protein
MIYEYYDKLVQIWGSTPNVSPLKFGVSADNFKTIQVIQLYENDVNLETDCSPALNTSESGHDLGLPWHWCSDKMATICYSPKILPLNENISFYVS